MLVGREARGNLTPGKQLLPMPLARYKHESTKYTAERREEIGEETAPPVTQVY